MPNLDDELRRRMQRAGRRVDSDGLEARLNARRTHKQITQKVGRGFLAVAVLAGSAFGVAGLNRAFRGDEGLGQVPAGGGGTIAYLRMLRSCEPGIEGPSTDVVALDVASGELRVVRTTRFFTDSGRPIAERAPEFSPDGTKMAWADRYGYDLDVTDVATGRTETLTHGLSVGAPHWSPDGTKLLFAAGEKSNDPSGESDFLEGPDAVYTMNSDGSDLTKLIDGSLPIWSPDGRIAFIRRGSSSKPWDPRKPQNGPTAFYIMNADGTGIEQVYEGPADVPIRDAEWSPDGTRIVAEATYRLNTDIFVVDLGLRTAVRLTDDPGQDTSPTWSPDGTMIAFQTGRWMGDSSFGEVGHSEIAVMNADGSDVRRITADCVDDYEPTWLRNDAAVMALPISGHTGSTTDVPTAVGPAQAPEGINGPVCDVERADLALGGSGTGRAFLFRRLDGDACDPASPQELGFSLLDQPVAWTLPVPGCGPSVCSILGTPDLSGDGYEVLAIARESGASSTEWTVSLYAPKVEEGGAWRLEPVIFQSEGLPSLFEPGPVEFQWGGSPEHFGRMSCGFDDPMGVGNEGGIVLWIADMNDDGTYRLREDLFDWNGVSLTYFDNAGTESIALEDIGDRDQQFCGTPVVLPDI
jgi:Tol biopolymer transport system component